MLKVVLVFLTVLIASGLFFFMSFREDEGGIPSLPEELVSGEVLYFDDVAIRLEFAETAEERQKGLSGRESLPRGTGLFFVFPESDLHGIWMRDMRFPIDVIWLNESLVVVDTAINVTPATFPKVFQPQVPARYVLETNYGLVEVHGIKPGMQAFFRSGARSAPE